MFKKKITYYLASISLLLLFLSPMLIKSYHDVFEHSHEEKHSHDVASFCGEEVTMCMYDDFTFAPLTTINFVATDVILTETILKTVVAAILQHNIVSVFTNLKGRAPPRFF